jgi:hypothetical protein
MISPQAWEQFVHVFSTVRYQKPGHPELGSRTTVGSLAIHTCEGIKARWDALQRAGLVEPDMRSPFGHPFNYRLTERGKRAIESGEAP